MSDREPLQEAATSGNIATPEYLDALWLEALRWPDSEAEDFCRARHTESPMRCPRCGEVCWKLWNGQMRRREWMCLEDTCAFRWWQRPKDYKVMEVQRGE